MIPEIPGIYALFDEDSLVYIGSTKNLRRRISDHLRMSPKRTFRFASCRKDRLQTEAVLISQFRPRFNRNRLQRAKYVFVEPGDKLLRGLGLIKVVTYVRAK